MATVAPGPGVRFLKALVVAVVVVSAWPRAGDLGAAASAVQESAGVVRSACEYDYPPYCIVEEGDRASGFSVELLRAALAAVKRDVSFRVGPWAEVKGWLENGEVDALPVVGRTPERERSFDFTFPYLSLHGTIVVRQDETGIHDLDDLVGRDVAVMEQDNAEEFLRRSGLAIDIHTTPTFSEALRELADGRHDAVVVQRLVAVRLIHEEGIPNLRIVDKPIEEMQQEFCFAVREGDEETLRLLNEGLAVVMADGTFQQLQRRWFGGSGLPMGHVVVGGDYNYPPYEFLDEEGRPTGFNVELTRAVANCTGLDIEIRLGPWAEIRQGMIDGEIDAIQGMFYSEERDLYVDFSPPHLAIHHVAVAREGAGRPPGDQVELRGKRIVVMRGDIMHDWAVEHGLGAKVDAVATQEEALRLVAHGQYDCALVARLPAIYWIKKNRWDDLVASDHPLVSPGYCYAVANNRTLLLSRLSEGLKIVYDSGEYKRIHAKWFGTLEDESPSLATAFRFMAIAVLPLFVLLLITVLWSRMLRKKVASRTAELRRGEERYRRLVENAPAVVYQFKRAPDGAYSFPFVAPKIIDVLGVPAEDAMADASTLLDLIPATDRGAFRDGVEESAAGLTLYRARVRALRDGEVRWIEAQATPDALEDGSVIWEGFLGDITERVQAEEERRIDSRRLQFILELHRMGVSHDREFSDYGLRAGIELSSSEIGFLGFMDDEEAAMTIYRWSDSVMEECAVAGRPMVFEIKETGLWGDVVRHRAPLLVNDYSASHPSKRGLPRGHVRVRRFLGVPVFDGDKIVAVGGFANKAAAYTHHDARNVSLLLQDMWQQIKLHRERRELAQLEASVRRAQHMESLGVLAGGVAHDFNNMLGAITGYADLAMESVAPDSEVHDYLEQLMVAANRAAQIVEQVLAFSRRAEAEMTVVSLEEIVEETVKLMRSMLPSSIVLRYEISSGTPVIRADATQIQQVIINLCTNANHAMPDGGELSLKLTSLHVSRSRSGELPEMPEGDYAHLCVRDTGVGIPPEVLDRVFEPFFTTKEVGKGSGMGLATSHGIVTSHGGFISVDSEPRNGSAFHVYLPAADVQRVKHVTQDSGAARRGRERILVVDDEQVVLGMTAAMLRSLGYDVSAFAEGNEALSALARNPSNWDLVITDQTMPHVDGLEVMNRVRLLRRELPVVIMTGHSDKLAVLGDGKPQPDGRLRKPFRRNTLAETVRQVLDRARA